ncbi:MAG: M48 family metallopeptidase [Erysipelothrix sp.]|nr:M48 family metallopeptidase [Erysipelothrix sp.]
MIVFEIVLSDQKYSVFLSKKPRKNINLRIKKDNQLYISKPKRVTISQLEKYLKDNSSWINQSSKKINTLAVKRNSYLKKDLVYIFDQKYKLITTNIKSITLNDSNLLISENHSQKDLKDYLNIQLLDYINQTRDYLDDFLISKNIDLPQIKIKKMKGKWGSCYVKTSVIYINENLIHYPSICLDYVLMHEYMHLIVPNHSKLFYELIKSHMPNYKSVVKYLKEN